MKMSKIKHDLELKKMAEKLMQFSWNRPNVDKSHVLELLFNWNDFYRQVRRNATHKSI